MTKGFIAITIRLYRLFLYLYPVGFREVFGDEMERVFSEQIQAAAFDGRIRLLTVCGREFGGLIFEGIRQRVYAWQARPMLVAQAGDGATLLGSSRRPFLSRRVLVLLLLFSGTLLLCRAAQNLYYVTLDDTFDVRHVALADLNGDGHLDAFLSVGSIGDGFWRGDRVVFNDGHGGFTDSGQELGEWRSFAAATGDVNNDGHVDVIVGNYVGLMRYQNDGRGSFGMTQYWPSHFEYRSSHLNVALADLDGDGSLDVFVTSCCGWHGQSNPASWMQYSYSEAWINDGTGSLASTGQQIGRAGSNAAALEDLNGDGTVDAFLANGQTLYDNGTTKNDFTYNTPNTVWFNDGQGHFNDSGQQLGRGESMAVALGDVNGDGFLDAVVGNDGLDEVWLNDGQGNFKRNQRLGIGLTWSVFLADLDGDGDLDLVAGGETGGRAWLNKGTGRFSAGQRIRYDRYDSIALGDVTGDGRIDIFAGGVESYQVWQGEGNGRFTAGPRTDYR